MEYTRYSESHRDQTTSSSFVFKRNLFEVENENDGLTRFIFRLDSSWENDIRVLFIAVDLCCVHAQTETEHR